MELDIRKQVRQQVRTTAGNIVLPAPSHFKFKRALGAGGASGDHVAVSIQVRVCGTIRFKYDEVRGLLWP